MMETNRIIVILAIITLLALFALINNEIKKMKRSNVGINKG
jgi:hypothetical protein